MLLLEIEQSSLHMLEIFEASLKMVKQTNPDYEITLVRDSSSRYLIGGQGYGAGLDAGNIPQRVRFDLREAGIEAGREHYNHMSKLPGQIKVRKVRRKIEVIIE